MNKRIRTRLIVTLAVALASIFLFAGFPPSLAKMREKVRLGLDLRGGIHLRMQVVTEDALRIETDGVIDTLRQRLQRDNLLFRQTTRVENDSFQIIGVDPNKDQDFRNILTEILPDWDLTSTTGEVPNTYTVKLKPAVAQALRDQSVDQAIQTINNRINELGVTEPTIQKLGGQGRYQILVQLPGVDDPVRVKGIMKSTALLELKLVEGGNSYPSQEAALQQYGGVLPADKEVLPSAERNPDGSTAFYVVSRSAAITGRDLKGAYPSRDENGRPAVTFNLTAEGAQKFGNITGQNVGRLLAIVLDRRIQSAPRINSRITDSGQITGGPGGFAPQQAQDLSLVLRSGALPATIQYLDERLVGASLGADSIRSGLVASIAALIGVVVFVLFYYKWAGMNAAVSMVLNLLILFGALAYFDAVLTLPGIAGVILTIGVGIDSNVLIFERIREELKAGKQAMAAVTAGFQRVFTTIVDTHLAALISALFLFLFGSGPVKGFAVTLVIGLVANVFTAVYVSRTLFEWTLNRRGRTTELSI
jgi:preprotein translocase subunit SecD